MKPTKRTISKFPISKIGIAYCACGVFLFFSGIMRGELVSTICGSSLLMFAMFCFVCAAVGALKWKTAQCSLSWEGKNTAILELAHSSLKSFRPVFFTTPFFESTFRVHPKTSLVLPFRLSLSISKSETRHTITIPTRGIYYPEHTAIVIKDFAAFFRFALFMPESMYPEPLKVYPDSNATAHIPLPVGKTGISQGKSTVHRSQELYESRPYVPGDDPRKINWKVSAHTGSPILREGELLPPPSTEYVFLFNTEILNQRIKNYSVKKDFDLLVSRAAFIARTLSAQNKIVSVATLSAREDKDITTIDPRDPDAKTALILAFSNPQPIYAKQKIREQGDQSPPRIFFERDASFLLFTMPECADIPEIASIPKTSSVIVCGPANNSMQNNAKLQTLCSLLSSGGFNVAQI